MLKLGLLGCGRIGQIHGMNAANSDKAKLVALSDAVPEAAQAMAAKTHAEIRETDEIINADDIDAILVCTSTPTHYDIIHKAAAAGKAIFCEKPLDMSIARSRECTAVTQKHDVPMMLAFNRRFDPNFAILKDKVVSGEIGDVEMITILSRDPAPAPMHILKNSGGLFQDMMIHDFDMARFLLGEEPVEIQAAGSVLVDPEIGEIGDVDTASVILKTASGKICQISNSRRASYGYDQRIEIHGSKGMLRAHNQLENTVEIANENGFSKAPAQHFFLERYELAYRRELNHFIDSVVENTEITPSGVDGVRAQTLAELAMSSLKEGKTMTVPLD